MVPLSVCLYVLRIGCECDIADWLHCNNIQRKRIGKGLGGIIQKIVMGEAVILFVNKKDYSVVGGFVLLQWVTLHG